MLHSFRQQNSWFCGDIIVIHDGLASEHLNLLTGSFDDLVPRRISSQLQGRLDKLCASVPAIKGRALQFGSLEALACSGYERLIFCDSDLLFLDTIEELTEASDALLCCADGANLRGNCRRTSNFSEVSARDAAGEALLCETFNSGFMVFDSELLNQSAYQAILDMITPDRWMDDHTGHTDQMLLNKFFAGRQTIVPSEYNYPLLHHDILTKRIGMPVERAKVLHFNGPAKPWLAMQMIGWTTTDPILAGAFHRWFEIHANYLSQHGLSQGVNSPD